MSLKHVEVFVVVARVKLNQGIAMLEIKALPLTPESFIDFGDVIDSRTANSFPINAGESHRVL